MFCVVGCVLYALCYKHYLLYYCTGGRRWAEIVGELKQENMYLERKIEHLNTQLQAKVDYEDSYKSRIRLVREELQEVGLTLKSKSMSLY